MKWRSYRRLPSPPPMPWTPTTAEATAFVPTRAVQAQATSACSRLPCPLSLTVTTATTDLPPPQGRPGTLLTQLTLLLAVLAVLAVLVPVVFPVAATTTAMVTQVVVVHSMAGAGETASGAAAGASAAAASGSSSHAAPAGGAGHVLAGDAPLDISATHDRIRA